MKGLVIFIGFLIFLILVLIRYLFVLQTEVDNLKYRNADLKRTIEDQQKRIMTLKLWNESYEETSKKAKKRTSDSPRAKKKSDATK